MSKPKGIRTTDFWAAAGERAVATFAQTLVALIGVDALTPVWELGWAELLGTAVLAALLSVLKSVGAGAVTGTPSVGHLEDPAPLLGGLPPDDVERGL